MFMLYLVPLFLSCGKREANEFGVEFKVGICERVRKEEKLT
jgi:hypothetical protein